jgi:hypothetical protein
MGMNLVLAIVKGNRERARRWRLSLACRADKQSRRLPPVGRVLRILLGFVLIIYLVPAYLKVRREVAAGSLLLVVGLIGLLHPNSYLCVATNRAVWSRLWGDCGERVAGRAVCCRCLGVTDRWPWQGAARSSHVPRYLVSCRWRARRSRLRIHGHSKCLLSKACRASVSHLLSSRQVGG